MALQIPGLVQERKERPLFKNHFEQKLNQSENVIFFCFAFFLLYGVATFNCTLIEI